MRTLAILIFPTLLAAPAVAQVVPAPKPRVVADRCAPTANKTAGQIAKGIGKLGDEPPAAQILSVYTHDANGCPAPVVLREGVGANPQKALLLARGGTLQPVR